MTRFGTRPFVALLAAGFALRLVILAATAGLGPEIVDEQHYVQLATSLSNGDGFAWGPNRPTSLRPPLYPALVAAVWSVAGAGNLQAVRVLQFGLSFLTVWVVFELGRRAFDADVGRAAAALVWLYPSLVFFNFTVLTETLFTLLLLAFVLFAVMLVQTGRAWIAVSCGLALGLGALTRSVLWPVPLVLCPLLALVVPGALARRFVLSALVFAGFAVVVAPWAIRNTQLQGIITVVDTMGGLNLRMGNYEHTPDDRMWDAVSLEGERNWVHAFNEERRALGLTGPVTEGDKDKWAQRKAFEYMVANPGTTLRRATIKFADFWGLERSFVAGVQQGLYAPPVWFTAAVALAMIGSYAVLALAGWAGVWLAPAPWRANVILLLPLVAVTGAHIVAFGHERYHVPLVPILALYAFNVPGRWSRRGPTRVWFSGAAALSVAALGAIWARQIVVTDGARIAALLEHLTSH